MKPITIAEKAFAMLVASVLNNFSQEQLTNLWFTFVVDFMQVSGNATISADSESLGIMFEDPNEGCDEFIKLLTELLIPQLQEMKIDFDFTSGFSSIKSESYSERGGK